MFFTNLISFYITYKLHWEDTVNIIKQLERSSSHISVSPVRLVWIKVHPSSKTKQPQQRISLHRETHKQCWTDRKTTKIKTKKWLMEGWRLTCPAFSMLMSSLGQLFETLKESKSQENIYLNVPMIRLKTLTEVSLACRRQCAIWLLLQQCLWSAAAFRNKKLDLRYLPTRPAKGWTCRDVPMMMRRSQRGKSWQAHISGEKSSAEVLQRILFERACL